MTEPGGIDGPLTDPGKPLTDPRKSVKGGPDRNALARPKVPGLGSGF